MGVTIFRDVRETPGSFYFSPEAAIGPPARETTMRTRHGMTKWPRWRGPGGHARGGPVLALGLLLTLVSAGCARGGTDDTGVATASGAKPTASASASAAPGDDTDAPVKFAQCMRAEGISWFPDPKPGGGMSVSIPNGTDKAKVDKAMEACKKYAPNGGVAPKPDAAALEQARQMSKCMRENGVPKFPDPKADGSIQIDGSKVGMGPGDPTFDAAEKACAKYQPKGAVTERHSEGDQG